MLHISANSNHKGCHHATTATTKGATTATTRDATDRSPCPSGQTCTSAQAAAQAHPPLPAPTLPCIPPVMPHHQRCHDHVQNIYGTCTPPESAEDFMNTHMP
eukprot:5816216-Amphidinium_carterae.1